MKKIILLSFFVATTANAVPPRARDLGIPFDGTPGTWNAITDVPGVSVGYSTLIKDVDKEHAVRTGVTAILPRGHKTLDNPVYAALFSLNGNGEMTGAHWIEESGFLEGPLMITNTHSVGAVHEALIRWRLEKGNLSVHEYPWSLPVVAETWDGELNDTNGFHVQREHVFAALDSAKTGPLAEGNVGGGTGMICHEFKCGSGSSSRRVAVADKSYTVGVFVQANYGIRDTLRIAGKPVGQLLRDHLLWSKPKDNGSIIIVVATDAPLLPHQLKRLAKRAALGLGRNGSYAGNGSGDIFLAFSTAFPHLDLNEQKNLNVVGLEDIDPLFRATVDATEEAIINAMVAARTMTGQNGFTAHAIDHEALKKIFVKSKAK